MSTVLEQPRNDVPIVTDATLLAVPSPQDEAGRAEYLKKIRALRNTPAQAEPQAAAQETVDPADQPDLDTDLIVEDSDLDAIDAAPTQNSEQSSESVRLSADDLQNYLIPVTDENGETQYLSYDEFNKTVGTYSKQNKKSRELAEKEREVEALRTQLLERSNAVVEQTVAETAKLEQRFDWITKSIAHAHKTGADVVKFADGTQRTVNQLLAEKTALESRYLQIQQQQAAAQSEIETARETFLQAQNEILDARNPKLKTARTDVSRYLERNGFTSEQSNALVHGKAELLILLDKAMRYDNAVKSQSKEKRVAQNTRVLGQKSRLEGRGVSVSQPQSTRIQELEKLGNRANRDQLRELYRLKQGR